MNLKKASLFYILFSGIIYLAAHQLKQTTEIISPHFTTLFYFYFFFSIAAFTTTYFSSKLKTVKNSLMLIMYSSIARLVISFLFFIIITSYTNDYSVKLALNFFTVYLLFTVFEIFVLVAILRADFKNTNTSGDARQ